MGWHAGAPFPEFIMKGARMNAKNFIMVDVALAQIYSRRLKSVRELVKHN